MNYEYTGKQVLISGASSGIGAEFAEHLHKRGANLILMARRLERLSDMAQRFNNIRNDSAIVWKADLTKLTKNSQTDLMSLDEIVEKIDQTQIDILINNAGVGSFGYFSDLPDNNDSQIILLNVYAFSRIMRATAKNMKARRKGIIINISSVAAFQPLTFMATYAASKVFNLFQSLAVREELRDYGVKVLAVCPGPTETEFFGVARVPGKPTAVRRDTAESVVLQSLKAVETNKSYIVTGIKAKLMAMLCMCLPFRIGTFTIKLLLKSSLPK